MKYIKAKDVLPENIIEIIQEYIDGECLYIPRKNGNEKSWGEKSGTKNSLEIRDKKIYDEYMEGKDIIELTQIYYLSEQSIRRIIRNQRIVLENCS